MEKKRFIRTEMLIGEASLTELEKKTVAVFGIGGVGGYVCEGLARAGIGKLVIIDDDKVSETNINRQLIALTSTVGKYKVDVMEERLRDINPDLVIEKHRCFFTSETSESFDLKSYDYVVDAIDTVTGKIELIMKAKEADTPVISAMGAGNKLNPALFEVADIYKTSVCPLARVMRREMKKRGVKKLKVVYSKEVPREGMVLSEELLEMNQTEGRSGKPKKSIPGSISFVPPVMGLILAGEVVRDMI